MDVLNEQGFDIKKQQKEEREKRKAYLQSEQFGKLHNLLSGERG